MIILFFIFLDFNDLDTFILAYNIYYLLLLRLNNDYVLLYSYLILFEVFCFVTNGNKNY